MSGRFYDDFETKYILLMSYWLLEQKFYFLTSSTGDRLTIRKSLYDTLVTTSRSDIVLNVLKLLGPVFVKNVYNWWIIYLG